MERLDVKRNTTGASLKLRQVESCQRPIALRPSLRRRSWRCAAMVDTVRGRLGVFIYSRHRRFVSQLILDKQGANFSSRDGAPGSDELSFSLFHLLTISTSLCTIYIYNLGVPSHLPSPCHLYSECAPSLCLSFQGEPSIYVLFQFLIILHFLQNCNLVRSQSNTGQCFSEPECEQKCNTRYEMVSNCSPNNNCLQRYEQQCNTVNERQCSTVNEQQCSTTTQQV